MGRAIIKICITCYESTELRELFLTRGLVRRWSKGLVKLSLKEFTDFSQQKRAEKAFQMLETAKPEGRKVWKAKQRIRWRASYVMVKSSGFIP